MEESQARLGHAGMEGDIITLQDLFIFDRSTRDEHGHPAGALRPTGLRPKFLDELHDAGINVDLRVFASEQVLQRPPDRRAR